MKVLKVGKTMDIKMICPHCDAVLMVNKNDAKPVEIGGRWTRAAITCPCCGYTLLTEWENLTPLIYEGKN